MADEQQPDNAASEALEEDQVTLDSQVKDGDNAELLARIASLEEELNTTREQALRAAAEAQNARRRAEQDVEKAHKFGVEKFAKDMLSVADNLERTLQAAAAEGAELATLIEGVELIAKDLRDGMARHKVEVVDPAGEPFNPEFHQAMSMVPNPDVEPNTVIEVFQKGFTLHGRLLRPAMVVVSKA